MNETINNILSRRSVRKYDKRQISDDDLNLLIKSAIYAPSGRNMQTWHLTVVQSKDLLNEISEAVAKDRNDETYKPFYDAPTVIFMSGDESSDWMKEDCAAATENIMLAAQSLGIGSCWIGCIRRTLQGPQKDFWKKKLDVPSGHVPMYAVALGYFEEGFNSPLPHSRKEGTVSYIK